MYLKIFVIVLALPSLLKANEEKMPAKPSEDEPKEEARRSLYSGKSRSKTLKELSLQLAKLRLIEESFVGKSKTLNYPEDKCSTIKGVGEPIVHRHSGAPQGAWMKDPLGILGAQKIWYMNGYYGKQLSEFKSMGHFKAGIVDKTYDLPYYYDGTGAVVYGRYLYYNRANTNKIVQYDLVTESIIKEKYPYTSSIKPRQYYYSWSSYNTFDLSVDESGLWVLYSYSSYKGKMCASQLDTTTMNTLRTFCGISSETMASMGNAFVACGKVYFIDSYSAKTTTINYIYDTATGLGSKTGIKFVNKFGYNTMVTYNPREKVLYAWDNQRQVTYPLEFHNQ